MDVPTEIGPLTFPSLQLLHDSLTTSEPKRWWKKQPWAGQPSPRFKFLLSVPKPSPFVSSSAKKNSPLEILSSHSGPNVPALHETVMQLASWRGGVMKTNGLEKPWIMRVTIKEEPNVAPCWAPINHWKWWRRWELIYTHTNVHNYRCSPMHAPIKKHTHSKCLCLKKNFRIQSNELQSLAFNSYERRKLQRDDMLFVSIQIHDKPLLRSLPICIKPCNLSLACPREVANVSSSCEH